MADAMMLDLFDRLPQLGQAGMLAACRWAPSYGCRSCGPVDQVIRCDAEYAARFAGKRWPACSCSRARRRSHVWRGGIASRIMGDTLCARCGVNKINRRRDGSWFATCVSCRG